MINNKKLGSSGRAVDGARLGTRRDCLQMSRKYSLGNTSEPFEAYKPENMESSPQPSVKTEEVSNSSGPESPELKLSEPSVLRKTRSKSEHDQPKDDDVIDNYADEIHNKFENLAIKETGVERPAVERGTLMRCNSAPPRNVRGVLCGKTISSRHVDNRRHSAPVGHAKRRQTVIPRHSVAMHRRSCYQPGPHTIDVQNAFSPVTGPNSDLNSLLRPKPRPRDLSKGHHHLSAWYQVPGRYTTPTEVYPRKRSQKRVKLRSQHHHLEEVHKMTIPKVITSAH